MPDETLMEVLIERIKGLSEKIEAHTKTMKELPCQVNSTKLDIMWNTGKVFMVAVALFVLNKVLALIA